MLPQLSGSMLAMRSANLLRPSRRKLTLEGASSMAALPLQPPGAHSTHL